MLLRALFHERKTLALPVVQSTRTRASLNNALWQGFFEKCTFGKGSTDPLSVCAVPLWLTDFVEGVEYCTFGKGSTDPLSVCAVPLWLAYFALFDCCTFGKVSTGTLSGRAVPLWLAVLKVGACGAPWAFPGRVEACSPRRLRAMSPRSSGCWLAAEGSSSASESDKSTLLNIPSRSLSRKSAMATLMRGTFSGTAMPSRMCRGRERERGRGLH
jgi:hypothetical protein